MRIDLKVSLKGYCRRCSPLGEVKVLQDAEQGEGEHSSCADCFSVFILFRGFSLSCLSDDEALFPFWIVEDLVIG